MKIKKRKSGTYKYIVKRRKRLFKWPLDVYKEWYRYCVLAGENKEFSEWFDPALYAEPLGMDKINVVKRKDSILTLEVDIRNDAKTNLRSLLKVLLKYGGYWKETKPQAEMQPTQSKKDMKFVTLQQARKVYLLKQKGLKNLDIAIKVGLIKQRVYDYKVARKKRSFRTKDWPDNFELDKTYLNAERSIQRNYKLAKQIIQNVKSGTFP